MRPEERYMRLALGLARRGYGSTSPNPMVGAVLARAGRVIGRGWHRRAGEPHAEIEALRDAEKRGHSAKGATLYVTLEPCCTHGRTPPCTEAIVAAGFRKVVVGATDPNPEHSGKGYRILRGAGISVEHGVLAEQCERLNEAFNHWIVHRTPFVTVKAGMTLDGKIATASGESRWITGEEARAFGMKMRQGADAILVGIETVLADDPSLTFRPLSAHQGGSRSHELRRIVLDARARTPLKAKVVSDEHAALTIIAVSEAAPKKRVSALAKRVRVVVVPTEARPVGKPMAKVPRSMLLRPQPLARSALIAPSSTSLDLRWLLRKLGSESVTSLLVEGGGEVHASFLMQGLAQRIAFAYAPMILGGHDSRRAVAGAGAERMEEALDLTALEWRRLGPDLLLTARVTRQ